MKYLTYQQVISFSTLTEHQIGKETKYRVPQSSAHTFPCQKYWPRTKTEIASDFHGTLSYPHRVRPFALLPHVLLSQLPITIS